MKVKALESQFIGHGGQSVWIGAGEEWDHDHPVVKDHPELFDVPAKEDPPKRGGALRRG